MKSETEKQIFCHAGICEEAEDLWKAAQNTEAIISTGANPNEQKFTVLLKDFYQKGLLGKPYYMEGEYIHWGMPKSAESVHLNENGDWRRLLIPIRYCTHSLGPLLTILDEDLRTKPMYEHYKNLEERFKKLSPDTEINIL